MVQEIPYIRFVDNNWQNFTGGAEILSKKHKKDSKDFTQIVNAGFVDGTQFLDF